MVPGTIIGTIIGAPGNAKAGWTIDVSTDSHLNNIQAKGMDSFIAKADTILTRANPYYVNSPVFSALLLPTDAISTAGPGCE